MIPIVPALIPTSASMIERKLPSLRFSPEIHIDVVDGKFVPFTSWPYSPLGEPITVSKVTDSFTLEVDLMVSDPLVAALAWLKAGADMLVFHIETISLDDFRKFKEQNKITISVSAQNDTALEELIAYLPYADGVQLMGIAKIGAQGQGFDERVFERIVFIKEKFPTLPITIDGSVNESTIVRLAKAGADRLICGSAIVQAENPALAYQKLQSLVANN